ncbi:MAG TPA: hypothetical protein VIW73_13260 [Candidatus Cybelea sp.]
MKRQNSVKYAIGICAALAVLAGCRGSQTPIGAPAAIPQTVAVATHADRGGSRMKSAPATTSLLFISDVYTSNVDIYDYPSGKYVKHITGLNQPAGECTDGQGDVWVVNASEILEYSHTGKLLNTLSDSGEVPVDCAVDPSGNLAVTNISTASGGNGSLSIYENQAGPPAIISSKSFASMWFDGFDTNGNLFIDGLSPGGAFQFGELPASSDETIKLIKVKGATIHNPGGVKTVLGRVTIEDQATSTIYRMTETGQVVGLTKLLHAGDCFQGTFTGKTYICPDEGKRIVTFYHYPAGGLPWKTITGSHLPDGSAISN